MKERFNKIIEKIAIKIMIARLNSKSYERKFNNWIDNFDEWLYEED